MNENDIKIVDEKIKQISNVIKIKEHDPLISFAEKVNITYHKIPKVQIYWKRLFILFVNWLTLIICYITIPVWSIMVALIMIPVVVVDEWTQGNRTILDRLKTGKSFWWN